jgi:hypothetical protein
MKKFFTLLLLTAFVGILLTSCKKKEGDPPVLPPEESMVIDFSNFTPAAKSADFMLQKGTEDYNWSFAVLATATFRGASALLTIPVAAFRLAIDQTPVFIENATWQWSYTYLSTFNVRLTGKIRSSDVLWNMYVEKTGTGSFDEFLWYTGTSKLDGTGGEWELNLSNVYPDPFLKITWTRSGTTITSVKYTYIREYENDGTTADMHNGSYITLSSISGTYDARFVISYYNGSAFSDAEIEWSTTGNNGRAKCLAYFGDTNWYVWDGSYLDP